MGVERALQSSGSWPSSRLGVRASRIAGTTIVIYCRGRQPPLSHAGTAGAWQLAVTARDERNQESWSGRRDSNPRHSAWEADTLPAELLPLGSRSTGASAWRPSAFYWRPRRGTTLGERADSWALLPGSCATSPRGARLSVARGFLNVTIHGVACSVGPPHRSLRGHVIDIARLVGGDPILGPIGPRDATATHREPGHGLRSASHVQALTGGGWVAAHRGQRADIRAGRHRVRLR
jgi:hypothetical protein